MQILQNWTKFNEISLVEQYASESQDTEILAIMDNITMPKSSFEILKCTPGPIVFDCLENLAQGIILTSAVALANLVTIFKINE